MMNARRMVAALILGCLCFPVAAPALGKVALIAPIPRPVPPVYDPPACPEPPPGYVYRWVPPVYQTVYERTWIEEVRRQVCDWVQVAPGRWEQVWTTTIIPAHWEMIARRELVSAGYWELVRIEMPPPRPVPMPAANPGTVGVEGYQQRGGEDLSKFSGLSEWPEKK
jgi:hypothetical protein